MPQRENQVSVSFNKKLYDLRAIKNAIQAYQGLADFNLETSKKNIELRAINIDRNLVHIFKDEFCNYILSEMKKIK